MANKGDGEEFGIELKYIPRVGECIKLKEYYYRVLDVVYYQDNSIYLHLGKSAESPEVARSKGYGIWNSPVQPNGL